MFRKKPLRVLDERGGLLWNEYPGNGGFVRSLGGTHVFRTPLDWLLGRPGSEMMCCGAMFRKELPPGTPITSRFSGRFAGIVGLDGRTVIHVPDGMPEAGVSRSSSEVGF